MFSDPSFLAWLGAQSLPLLLAILPHLSSADQCFDVILRVPSLLLALSYNPEVRDLNEEGHDDEAGSEFFFNFVMMTNNHKNHSKRASIFTIQSSARKNEISNKKWKHPK